MIKNIKKLFLCIALGCSSLAFGHNGYYDNCSSCRDGHYRDGYGYYGDGGYYRGRDGYWYRASYRDDGRYYDRDGRYYERNHRSYDRDGRYYNGPVEENYDEGKDSNQKKNNENNQE